MNVRILLRSRYISTNLALNQRQRRSLLGQLRKDCTVADSGHRKLKVKIKVDLTNYKIKGQSRKFIDQSRKSMTIYQNQKIKHRNIKFPLP